MPPLAPPHGEKSISSGGRHHQPQGMAAQQQQRSASFHGRGTEQQRQQKQRPKTLPDVLAGVRGGAKSFRSGSGSRSPPRTPSKVLVSVAVQQSMWPLHVMASAEWTVADLVAAAVALYVKEGRRPLLPSADPAAFGLHYSQFSLEKQGRTAADRLRWPEVEAGGEDGHRSFVVARRNRGRPQHGSRWPEALWPHAAAARRRRFRWRLLAGGERSQARGVRGPAWAGECSRGWGRLFASVGAGAVGHASVTFSPFRETEKEGTPRALGVALACEWGLKGKIVFSLEPQYPN